MIQAVEPMPSFVVPLLIYIGLAVLSMVVFYWLIKKAIRTALADHYKTVRHFENTGRWVMGPFVTREAPLDYGGGGGGGGGDGERP